MHVELLLEEESAEDALRLILPRILPAGATFDTRVFDGKDDLLSSLPARLKGYSAWLPEDYRLLVLVDRDDDDCHSLKERLEKIAAEAGLVSKTAAGGGPFQIVNRIAVEELEAWMFGDVPALCAAYPGVPATLGMKAAYRRPDDIRGGTAERLLHVLQQAGHFVGVSHIPKRDVARRVSEHMDPNRNTSQSFRLFCATLREIAEVE